MELEFGVVQLAECGRWRMIQPGVSVRKNLRAVARCQLSPNWTKAGILDRLDGYICFHSLGKAIGIEVQVM
jgi:hypothetical protein